MMKLDVANKKLTISTFWKNIVKQYVPFLQTSLPLESRVRPILPFDA